MPKDWRRLSPVAILFFTFRSLRSALNLYPALIGVVFTARQFDFGSQQFAMLAIAGFVLLALSAVLHWLNFLYLKTEDRILIRSGVFSKQRLELEFTKIQSVSVKTPFYLRPFGLVNLGLDSAGSAQNEVDIAALSRNQADSIKRAIEAFDSLASDAREGGVGDQSNLDAGSPARDSVEPLIARTTRDIVIHGITHNRAWFFIALLSPFFRRLEDFLGSSLERLGFDFSTWIDNSSMLAIAAGLVFLLFLFILITSLFSVFGSILALYNYRLSFRSGNYERSSGLFTRHEIKMKKSRLQALVYEKNWLDVIFRRLVMVMEPFSARGSQDGSGAVLQKIFIPSITDQDFNRLALHAYPDLRFDRKAFKPISPYYIRRKLQLFAPLIALGACSIAFIENEPSRLLFLLAIPIVALFAYLRWRRYGWQVAGNYILVRKGFIGVSYVCFPRYKVQQTQFFQSLMLKRRKLASVRLVLASRTVEVPCIKESDACDIINLTLKDIECSGLSWM